MASISYNSVRGLHGTPIYGPIVDINQFTTTCYTILQSSKELQWINFNPLFKFSLGFNHGSIAGENQPLWYAI